MTHVDVAVCCVVQFELSNQLQLEYVLVISSDCNSCPCGLPNKYIMTVCNGFFTVPIITSTRRLFSCNSYCSMHGLLLVTELLMAISVHSVAFSKVLYVDLSWSMCF